MRGPRRIVCLVEEPTEVLYHLGEQHRIVGISGFTVRPPAARREKPKVSAFTSAKIDRILALEPDLAIGFSDIQADIARDLVRHGVEVWISNHRSVAGILLLALSWLPAHLMALALALASDFDAVSRAWREHHQRHGQGLFHLDLDFLAATARACIDADDIEEDIDADLPTAAQDEPVRQAHGLVRRILVVWFVALAVLVLAGAG